MNRDEFMASFLRQRLRETRKYAGTNGAERVENSRNGTA
jgi:hypothetical protein